MNQRRNLYRLAVRIAMGVAVCITSSLALFLMGYVLIKGLPNLSWDFLTTSPSYISDTIGILPNILNTI